ncbi:MAG TPA: 50S ribosomal protein L24 [Candidatus Limnocylindrales bacterium]|nr:50S ribosomal protein L24 [Candidatus Limnocylindrales bacterium]
MATPTAQRVSPKVPEIRKGDTVVVLAGKDAGKRGVVERVVRDRPSPTGARSVYRRRSPRGGVKVVVEGLNVAKRHTKPRPTTGADRMPRIQQGGILDIALPIPISRVMVVCPRCDRPTRIGHATLETPSGPRRVRLCKHCGEPLEAQS